MKVQIYKDVLDPIYGFDDPEPGSKRIIDIAPRTLSRWRYAIDRFYEVQDEIQDVYERCFDNHDE